MAAIPHTCLTGGSTKGWWVRGMFLGCDFVWVLSSPPRGTDRKKVAGPSKCCIGAEFGGIPVFTPWAVSESCTEWAEAQQLCVCHMLAV
jgi:hypothetical protein